MPQNDYNEKFCFDCKFFELTLGTPDWSELTPGEMAALSCVEGHFYYTQGDVYDFGKTIRKARTCKDFEHSND